MSFSFCLWQFRASSHKSHSIGGFCYGSTTATAVVSAPRASNLCGDRFSS